MEEEQTKKLLFHECFLMKALILNEGLKSSANRFYHSLTEGRKYKGQRVLL